MLVLTRRAGERLFVEHLGDVLEITVLEVDGRVRLGFVGPRKFDVQREERGRAPRKEQDASDV
jgi:carbon storage regulator CsrA